MKLANRFLQLLIVLFLLTSVTYSQKATNQAILQQNFSNPFNPITVIRYSVPEGTHVSLRVYDGIGREAAVLVDEWKAAGSYVATFSATSLSSGLYLVNLREGRLNETKKLLFLK